jgi:hypothetical protein
VTGTRLAALVQQKIPPGAKGSSSYADISGKLFCSASQNSTTISSIAYQPGISAGHCGFASLGGRAKKEHLEFAVSPSNADGSFYRPKSPAPSALASRAIAALSFGI